MGIDVHKISIKHITARTVAGPEEFRVHFTEYAYRPFSEFGYDGEWGEKANERNHARKVEPTVRAFARRGWSAKGSLVVMASSPYDLNNDGLESRIVYGYTGNCVSYYDVQEPFSAPLGVLCREADSKRAKWVLQLNPTGKEWLDAGKKVAHLYHEC